MRSKLACVCPVTSLRLSADVDVLPPLSSVVVPCCHPTLLYGRPRRLSTLQTTISRCCERLQRVQEVAGYRSIQTVRRVPRPSARRRQRPLLAGEVGGVAVAQVAAATPLARRLAVVGPREPRLAWTGHRTLAENRRRTVFLKQGERHQQRDNAEPRHPAVMSSTPAAQPSAAAGLSTLWTAPLARSLISVGR